MKNAKPCKKPYKLADSGRLYLAIQPSGSKLWRLKYRFADKEKTVSYGACPFIGIAEARTTIVLTAQEYLDRMKAG